MPVGLIMNNKIETLHSTQNQVAVNEVNVGNISQSDIIENHLQMTDFRENQDSMIVNQAVNMQLSDECFKYLTKFKANNNSNNFNNFNSNSKSNVDNIRMNSLVNTESSLALHSNEDLFLFLNNNHNNEHINNIKKESTTTTRTQNNNFNDTVVVTDDDSFENNLKYSTINTSNMNNTMKIDTILLSPMSIPVESICTNNNTNYNENNSNTVINCLNSSSSLSSPHQSNFSINDNNSHIKNGLILKNQETLIENSTDNKCQIINESVTEVENELTKNKQDMKIEIVVIRNNIDFAIDAVLEKCRNENSSECDDEIFETISNSFLSSKNNTKKKSKNSNNMMNSNLINETRAEEEEPVINSIHLNDQNDISINETVFDTNNCLPVSLIHTDNTLFNSCEQQIQLQQQQNHQQQLLEQLQQQPMSKSSKARTSYISSLIANRKTSVGQDGDINCLNSQSNNHISTEEDKQKRISQNILTILANNNSQNKNNSQNTNIPVGNEQNFTSNDNSSQIAVTSSQEINNLSNTKVKKTKLPNKPKKMNKNNVNKSNCNETKSQEIDFVINSDSIKNPNNIPTYFECSNLKRLLSQPNIDASNFSNQEFLNNSSNNSMKSILMDSEFNNIKIDVKLLDSNNENCINHLSNNCYNKNLIASQLVSNIDNKLPVIENVVNGENISSNLNENKDDDKNTVTVTTKGKKRKNTTKSNDSERPKAKTPKKSKKSKGTEVEDVKNNEIQTISSDINSNIGDNNNIRNCTINVPQSIHLPQPINVPQQLQQNCQQLVISPELSANTSFKTTKTKKLKTIADIVKHNSEAQRNKLLAVSQNIPSQSQTHIQQPQLQINRLPVSQEAPTQFQLPVTNNISLPPPPPNFIEDSHFTNSHLVNDTDNLSNMNIDHLLELTYHPDNTSVNDKYIDLDDIDLSPLVNTQFTQNNVLNQSNFNHNNNTNNTGHLDEFNFQFSVCSSSSSGFGSEPSNFSTCSSQNGYNNAQNNSNLNNILSSESENSPINNVNSSNFNYENNGNNNTNLSSSSNYNLFQKTNLNNSAVRIQNTTMNRINSIKQPMNIVNSNSSDLEWNIAEFTTNSSSASMISNNNNTNISNNNNNNGQCNDNMFGSFSFLNDEIKLEI